MNKEAMRLEQVFPKKLLKSKAGKSLLTRFFRILDKLPASNYSKRIVKDHAELLPGLVALSPTPWSSSATAIFGLPYYAGIKNTIKQLAKGKATKALKALPKELRLHSKALKKAPFDIKNPTHTGFLAAMLAGPALTGASLEAIKKILKEKKKLQEKKSSLSQPEVIKLAAAIVIKNHPNFSPLTRPF